MNDNVIHADRSVYNNMWSGSRHYLGGIIYCVIFRLLHNKIIITFPAGLLQHDGTCIYKTLQVLYAHHIVLGIFVLYCPVFFSSSSKHQMFPTRCSSSSVHYNIVSYLLLSLSADTIRPHGVLTSYTGRVTFILIDNRPYGRITRQ